MSKKVLWVLTVALSLALAGLIIVQINWAGSALELKDKQLQQLVNTTLAEVSDDLEYYYAVAQMDSILHRQDSDSSLIKWLPLTASPKDAGINWKEGRYDDNEINDYAYIGENDNTIQILGDSMVLLRNKSNQVIDTMDIDRYYEFQQREEMEKTLQEQQVLVVSVIESMLNDDVALEDQVDKEILEQIMKDNFFDKGIDLSFEYAVIRNGNEEIFRSDNFSKNTDHYYFRVQLMVKKNSDENTYLYLYFPEQKSFVLGSLGFLGVSAAVLILVMMVVFTFALYVIFKQKRLSDIKSDFVNNMTHELKTPISTISLASQMLSDKSIPMEKKNTGNISKIIETESKRLGYQVERVLQMAVLDQGHLVLKKGNVHLGEIVGNVINNFQLQVEKDKGWITYTDESKSDLVYVDKVHFTNVLTNLIDNAVKYCKEKPEISVKLFNAGGRLIFSVKDNGIGISKDNQKKIFERFYRVSTGNVHDVKGFGLGLSYVKLIVEEHGGTISMNSELNKGTQIDIKIPHL
ncbi:MAG TPA: HAMP domain-containing sensor histidine kinase [Bacteroidales bacterium]|nr:HAMP domain-containing sensor histidine kinase [Bacteroidales bacterium]